MTDQRERLRREFDKSSDLYESARPGYPAELYDELLRVAALRHGDLLLEIGCATGKATVPLANRGMRITCLEIGKRLAAAAQRNLGRYPDCTVIQAAFEDWTPATSQEFDMVFAATAWHWIDPDVRYRKAWLLLRPGGHLAFWSATHVLPEGGDPFFAEIQEVYEEVGEGVSPGTDWPRPGELPDSRAEIQKTGLFDVVTVRQFDWEVVYDTEQYLALLDTFSGHIAMAPWKRDRLHGEIRRRLARRPNNRLRRHWGAVLHVARRRD